MGFQRAKKTSMLSETLITLQEVISSSIVAGARPELGALLLSQTFCERSHVRRR